MLYIYLLRAGKKHYKVGVTKNLVKRIGGIQTSNPNKIELITSKLVDMPFGIEKEIHQKLVDLASGGGTEWFEIEPKQIIELCVFINQYPHIELSERVLIKDLLERQLMWKKTVEKKMDIILNNYQKGIVRALNDNVRVDNNLEDIEIYLPKPTPEDLEKQVYEDAKQLVIKEGKASTSFLQRKLRIGYGRAARIIEELEEERVIGAADGPRARTVYTLVD